jgi:hypothetical protein
MTDMENNDSRAAAPVSTSDRGIIFPFQNFYTFPSTLEHKNGVKLWNLAKWPIGVSRLFESSCHKMKWCENTVSGL